MFFRLILFGIIFYYLFKFIARIFGVFIVNKAQKQYGNPSSTNYNRQHKKEGEINITKIPKDDKKHVKGGDYVDFEEIE